LRTVDVSFILLPGNNHPQTMLTNANTQMFVAGAAYAAPTSPSRCGLDETLRFGNVPALAERCAR
jgi:hypothetical protein